MREGILLAVVGVVFFWMGALYGALVRKVLCSSKH
jgi:hypothetical protein